MAKKEIKTKTKSLTSWLIFFIIALVVVIGGMLILNNVPYFKNRTNFAIVTDSMEPTLGVGDVVVVNTVFETDSLVPGDIIAFNVDLNEDNQKEVVLHYLASIEENEGVYTIKTVREGVEPTEPSNWDNWELAEEDLVGVFDFKIPFLGSVLLFLSSPFGKVVVVADIILILIFINLFGSKKVVEETHFKDNYDEN